MSLGHEHVVFHMFMTFMTFIRGTGHMSGKYIWYAFPLSC
jgi:hypothetical protein